MRSTNTPLLAITMGDPAGIGPEVVMKALAHRDLYERCRPLVIGDRRVLQRAAKWLPHDDWQYDVVDDLAHADFQPEKILLMNLGNAPPQQCPVGEISQTAGKAAVEYVFRACDLAMSGDVDAIVTAPLNKEAMNLAGYNYPGHTELLAERTNAERVSIFLVGPQLRVIHVSAHVSLEEAIRRVKRQRVEEVIHLAHDACKLLGIDQPRIGMAGLNPHASEGGLFGNQEAEEIVPAIEAARRRGLNVSDPQPGDTIFLRAVDGAYDIVVAMYHDQGHIPMKLLAFDVGVNVSMGLPIIRTSVDHGTAFDIAGTGQASESSLLAAIDVALTMIAARRQPKPAARRR